MPALTKPLADRGGSASDLKIALGEYIKNLRLKQNMTQADLARVVGMKYYTAISAIEVGRNTVPPERYLDFALALGVKPRTFMNVVLRLTNPWAHAMLFSSRVEDEIREINETFDTRVRRNWTAEH